MAEHVVYPMDKSAYRIVGVSVVIVECKLRPMQKHGGTLFLVERDTPVRIGGYGNTP